MKDPTNSMEYDYYDDYDYYGYSEDSCFKWCIRKVKADSTATGCRWDAIDQHPCASIRGAEIENGDGETDVICWELNGNVDGKIETICIKYFPIHIKLLWY